MARNKKKTSWKTWAGIFAAVTLIGIGSTAGSKPEPTPTSEPVRAAAPTVTPADTPEPVPTAEPTATPLRIHGEDPQTTVYVSNNNVIHFRPDCSGMKHYTEMTLQEADAAGCQICERCG